MTRVTIHEAKTNLSQLIRRAEAGEEIVIARGNEPVAILVGYAKSSVAERRAKAFGCLEGKVAYADDSVLFGEMSDEDFIEAFGPEFFDLHKPKSSSK